MPKKSTFMFFLIILSFLVIGAASASENNETDILPGNPDENPITSIELNEDTNGNEEIIKSRDVKADELKSDSLSNTSESEFSQGTNNAATKTNTTAINPENNPIIFFFFLMYSIVDIGAPFYTTILP